MMKVRLDVGNEQQNDRRRLSRTSNRRMITRTSSPIRVVDSRPELQKATIRDTGKVGVEAKLKSSCNVPGLLEQRT